MDSDHRSKEEDEVEPIRSQPQEQVHVIGQDILDATSNGFSTSRVDESSSDPEDFP